MIWKVFSSPKKLYGDSKTVREAVNSALIADVYRQREKEIDSLRQYDRGEKIIHAPNLRSIVRGL